MLISFIEACSKLKGFRQREDVTTLLRDVFHDILQRTDTPNRKTVSLGLEISEKVPDPLLAKRIALCCVRREVRRKARKHAPESTAQGERQAPLDEDNRQFSSPEVIRAVEICVKSGEMDLAQSILSSLDSLGDNVSSRFQSALHASMLKGFAQVGDSAAALVRLETIRETGTGLRYVYQVGLFRSSQTFKLSRLSDVYTFSVI